MAERKGFDLGDYVEVKDRIARFYDLFGQGRLVTHRYELTSEPDGKPKVIVQAHAYRTPDDPLPGVGTSWMYLPGTTPYTKGSELENVETSAWGRAIGALGILIDKSIATTNEIETKATTGAGANLAGTVGQPDAEPAGARDPDEPYLLGAWSETGKLTTRKSGAADGEVRQTPEGAVLQFIIETVDDKQISILARGPLAQDIYDAAEGRLEGIVATVEGNLYRVPWKKQGKPMRPYQRLDLRHIKTAAWSLPEPVPVSAPLFDERELDAVVETLP